MPIGMGMDADGIVDLGTLEYPITTIITIGLSLWSLEAFWDMLSLNRDVSP
jgi:hypothetical protein